jgi:hypothetical protein
MSCKRVESIAYVKGGMPVEVSGLLTMDREGHDLSDIDVCWSNTGKRVSKFFLASLDAKDWAAIEETLWNER